MEEKIATSIMSHKAIYYKKIDYMQTYLQYIVIVKKWLILMSQCLCMEHKKFVDPILSNVSVVNIYIISQSITSS